MILRSKYSQNGFAAVTLVFFLPLFLALLFSVAFVGYLVQHKTRLRSICLTDAREIQQELIRNEEKLFRLNPIARALRVRMKFAKAELLLAEAAENLVWIAQAKLKIEQIETEQAQLDQIQQGLITTAKFNLQSKTFLLKSKLQHNAREINSIWQFYMDSLTIVSNEPTEVAVERDSPDPAPVYELSQDYFERQRVAYSWHHRFFTKDSAQKQISGGNQFQMFCSVSAKKEETLWQLSINVDKF